MLIDVMLHYAARGWALLPMRGKIFAFRGKLRDAATRDPRVIEKWTWAQGVGLACGEPSNADVLDVDDPTQFPLDLTALLAMTLHATTPRGGFHLLFKFAGLRSRPFEWGEWRSTNLAIALPPAPGRAWANNLAIAEAPPELIELVKRPAMVDPPASFPWPFMTGDSQELPKPLYFAVLRAMPAASRHDQRRVMGALRKLVHAKHHRNNALNRAAFCFRTFVAEDLTTAEQARALLEMASAMNGYTAKDGIAEVRSTIASGLAGSH
jgi:hypothetical protein